MLTQLNMDAYNKINVTYIDSIEMIYLYFIIKFTNYIYECNINVTKR